MSVFAAVITGKGTSAIAAVQLFGEKADVALKKIFVPKAHKTALFQPGQILLGTITDGNRAIDHVTIGCEAPETFAINCHGNPIIIADIMKLLQKNGVKLLTAQQLLTKTLTAQKKFNTIEIEAKIAQLNAKTIEGTKILENQIDIGLSKKVQNWLNSIKTTTLDEIKAGTRQILETAQTEKLIIYGCTVAIVGPPNTGKSTLLNCLAGRQKAIVTDIKGTTRDWVSAQCKISPLSLTLIDTAGLDEELAATPKNIIEKKARQKSLEILAQADLLLLVLDNSQGTEKLNESLFEKITNKKILTVLNKSDLPAKFNPAQLPDALKNTVLISAKLETGIENLLNKIRQICDAADFELNSAVCFTTRQENLLKQLLGAKSKRKALFVITELLNGQTNGSEHCHCEESTSGGRRSNLKL